MPVAAGISYFFHEAGDVPARRPPLILIHGAGGNYLSWPPQIRRLEGERVYALDLPGHGQSDGLGRHSIEEYAADVFSFMKELNIRTAVLCGVSMGSAVALMFALKHPSRVAGLGLIGGGAKLPVSQKLLEMTANINTFEAAVDWVNEGCFSTHVPPALLSLSKKQMMDIRPPVLQGDFLACDEFDVVAKLDGFDLPALIVCGEEDRMTPVKFSELLHARMQNSQLHVIEQAGHMAMLETPEVVAGLLKGFLNDLPPRLPRTRKKAAEKNSPQPEISQPKDFL